MPANRDLKIDMGDILIVDDEIPNLQLLTQLLSKAGYQVRPAKRPQLAIQSALAQPPSLILLDVRMPEMDGFEVCRRLKQQERTRDIPIIFVSALQDVQDRIRGFEAGGVDFISKPFQEPEVLARVQTHLALRNIQLHLEDLVANRTAELTATNQTLEAEIGERKQAEERLQEYQQRLKALASQLTITEEKERRRLAADLHDQVCQSLALANIQLDLARKSTSESKLADKFNDISDTLLETLKNTKQLMFELSSPSMHEIGLSSAISEWLEVQIGNRHSLKTEVIDNIPDNRRKTLDPNVRAILFRNVRELLVNVVKHARAKKVSVRLEDRNTNIRIIVEDDGIGFDPRAVIQAGSKIGGFGLFSIEELMADLSGSLRIVSEPGKGCTAILSAPFGVDDRQERD
ncbi:MAG: response regulator [Desulfobulbaceae bacterium]|nr:response regulator [Desulfobulbaceae bacterium]